MWWFFHFLREYWRPFRGTTHQKSRCCAFQQFLPTKSFNRPPVTKGGTTAPRPKTHRPIRDSGKLSAREFSLRRLELQLSGECATSELSGRCVGVLTALPDPTMRQAGFNHGVMLRPRTPPVMLHHRGRHHVFFYCACRFLLGLYMKSMFMYISSS